MGEAHIQAVEECLIGVWSKMNEHSYGLRLILTAFNRGFLESWEPPTLISVEHFTYRVKAATVLEISDSWQEYLADDACSTLRDDGSSIEPGEYDIAFHSRPEGVFLDLEICQSRASFRKTEEPLSASYAPKWNLFGQRRSN
jgi:hypothetical protein